VTDNGYQFITLTVDIRVQHGGREAPRSAGLLAAADLLIFDIAMTYTGIPLIRYCPTQLVMRGVWPPCSFSGFCQLFALPKLQV